MNCVLPWQNEKIPLRTENHSININNCFTNAALVYSFRKQNYLCACNSSFLVNNWTNNSCRIWLLNSINASHTACTCEWYALDVWVSLRVSLKYDFSRTLWLWSKVCLVNDCFCLFNCVNNKLIYSRGLKNSRNRNGQSSP